MITTSELKRPAQAPERWTRYVEQRLNAKATAVCEAVLFNKNPTFSYACELSAQAVQTPGHQGLPPEIWHDIFIAGIRDRVDQTLSAVFPLEPLASEREERNLLERISSCHFETPCPHRLSVAWQTLKKLAPETFVDYGQPIDENLFIGYFDHSKIVCNTRRDADISSEWDRRSVAWWIRNLLKQPMPVDLFTQDEEKKERAKYDWEQSLLRPSLRNTYMAMDLPTKRLNEDIKEVILIADAVKHTQHPRTEVHRYRGYTFEELRYGTAHPSATSRERNYIQARRDFIVCSTSTKPAFNMGNVADLQWQLLQSQRSLLSAAWKYIGHSARAMGLDRQCASAAGGWRFYLLDLLHRDQNGLLEGIDPRWEAISRNMEKSIRIPRTQRNQGFVDKSGEVRPKWSS